VALKPSISATQYHEGQDYQIIEKTAVSLQASRKALWAVQAFTAFAEKLAGKNQLFSLLHFNLAAERSFIGSTHAAHYRSDEHL